MTGLILLALIAAAVAFAFLAGKGFRTTILGYATMFIGAVLPYATDVIGYLQTLDWRNYVLTWDRDNWLVLGIPFVLGLAMVILRRYTTGPVGTGE